MKRKASVTVTAPDTDTEQIQSRAEAERHRSAPEFADAGPAEWAARMYQRHPKKRDKILAENECVRLWQKFHAPHVQAAEIEAVHALWCKTESWREKNGQFAPTLASWLRDEGYMASPEIVEKKEKNVWLESLQPSS